jgi:hypothetical protein
MSQNACTEPENSNTFQGYFHFCFHWARLRSTALDITISSTLERNLSFILSAPKTETQLFSSLLGPLTSILD